MVEMPEMVVAFAKLVVFLALTLIALCGCQLICLTIAQVRLMRSERDDTGNPR